MAKPMKPIHGSNPIPQKHPMFPMGSEPVETPPFASMIAKPVVNIVTTAMETKHAAIKTNLRINTLMRMTSAPLRMRYVMRPKGSL